MPKSRPQWEYLYIKFSWTEINPLPIQSDKAAAYFGRMASPPALNELGQDGWELVTATPDHPGWHCLFKRSLTSN